MIEFEYYGKLPCMPVKAPYKRLALARYACFSGVLCTECKTESIHGGQSPEATVGSSASVIRWRSLVSIPLTNASGHSGPGFISHGA